MFDAISGLMGQYPVIGQALAGAAGGVVRTLTPPHGRPVEIIPNVIIGALCAVYLGPVALGMLQSVTGIEISEQGNNLGAFLVGLFGMTLTGFMIDALKIAREKRQETDDDA